MKNLDKSKPKNKTKSQVRIRRLDVPTTPNPKKPMDVTSVTPKYQKQMNIALLEEEPSQINKELDFDASSSDNSVCIIPSDSKLLERILDIAKQK